MLGEALTNIRGNPILTRHLATTFTGPRLGLAILFVSAALVGLYGILFTAATYGDLSPGVTYLAHNGVLLGLLIILLPLKVSGTIEGPRLNRAFDQIVATGASPPVLFLGAWLSGIAYAGLLLFVTIPFAACMVTFGDADIPTMLRGYLTLLAYSNVIIAVTLALSVFGREWLSTPLAIAVLAAFTVLAFIFDRDFTPYYPPLLAELSPIRLLVQQSGLQESDLRLIYGMTHAKLLLWPVSVEVVRPILWVLVMGIGALLFTVGPGHRFAAGLDNFGAVVMKGDRKRGILGRLRGGITRRVEMGFFYENAPRWTQHWGGFLRYALTGLPLVLAWIVSLGAVWVMRPMGTWTLHPVPYRIDAFEDEKLLTSIILTGGLLALWGLLSSSGRSSMLAPVSIGRRLRVPTEVLLTGMFIVLAGLLYWFQSMWVAAVEQAPIAGKIAFRTKTAATAADVQRYVADAHNLILAMLLFAANLFLVSRLASRLADGFIRVRILAVLGYGVLFAVPGIAAGLIYSEQVTADLTPIANFSPAVLHPDYDGEVPGYAWEDFMMMHGILAGVMLAVLALRYLPLPGFRARGGVTGLMLATVMLAAVVAPGTASAQESEPRRNGPLVIRSVTRGFDGAVFSYRIDFYTAEVENTSDATLRVKCWVEGFDSRWGGGEFVLSPRSRRTLRWGSPPHANYRRFRRGGGETRVVFEAGGVETRSPPLDVIEMRASQPRTNRKKKSRLSEQHLFVGSRGSFPQAWIDLAHGGIAQNLVACEPRDLPTSARSYDGLELVWMTASALAALDRQQQDALHHYLMLGGAVVFFGGLPSAELSAAGDWGQLLRPEEEWDSKLGEVPLRHVRLREGEDVLSATVPGGTKLVPVLNARRVGVGFLGHLAFPPAVSKMPKAVAQDLGFWNDFDAAIPRGGFPLTLDGVADSRSSGDYSALFYLGGYYVIYALGLSAGLFFFARRRHQRRRMWLQIGIVPILFLAMVPILTSAAESRKSQGEHSQVAYYHAGSTRGVVATNLLVHSSGKRRHSMVIDGARPSALVATDGSRRHRYYWTRDSEIARFEPLDLGVAGKGQWKFDFEIPPWTTGELAIFDSHSIDEPVTGHARLGRSQLDIEVEVPDAYRDRELYILVQNRQQTRSSRVEADASGRVRMSTSSRSAVGGSQMRDALQAHRTFVVRGRTPVQIGSLTWPRVFLAVAPPVADQRTPPIQSDDVTYERSVPERAVELARQRRSSNRRRPRRRFRKDGAGFVEILDHRLTVFQLPLVK